MNTQKVKLKPSRGLKKREQEISKELTECMSAGNDSKLKFALFSTFHRVLNDIIVSEGTAKALIILQVVQLIAMIINDSNTVLI